MVVYGQVRRCGVSHGETLSRSRDITGEAAAPLNATGVGVEVGVAAAYGAPVEQALVRHVRELVERAVQRFRLAPPSTENPGDTIGQAVRVAGPAVAPGVLRRLAFELPRNDATDRHAEEVVVGDTQRGEE